MVDKSGGAPIRGLRKGQIFWEDDGGGGSGYTRGVLLLGIDAQGRVQEIQVNPAGQVVLADQDTRELLTEIRDLLQDIRFRQE